MTLNDLIMFYLIDFVSLWHLFGGLFRHWCCPQQRSRTILNVVKPSIAGIGLGSPAMTVVVVLVDIFSCKGKMIRMISSVEIPPVFTTKAARRGFEMMVRGSFTVDDSYRTQVCPVVFEWLHATCHLVYCPSKPIWRGKECDGLERKEASSWNKRKSNRIFLSREIMKPEFCFVDFKQFISRET